MRNRPRRTGGACAKQRETLTDTDNFIILDYLSVMGKSEQAIFGLARFFSLSNSSPPVLAAAFSRVGRIFISHGPDGSVIARC